MLIRETHFFSSFLFGINKLRSDEMSYFDAKYHCSAAIVQKLRGFSDYCGTIATTSTEETRAEIAGGLPIHPDLFA
jgi:hypothetical protein